MWRVCIVIAATVSVLGCGTQPAGPSSPSPARSVLTTTISPELSLPTVRHRPTMCVPTISPSTSIRPNLTCVVAESCMSTSLLQLAVRMILETSQDGTIRGSSDMTGTEKIRICNSSVAESVAVALSYPLIGSVSNVVFGGTTSAVDSLQGSTHAPANVKRTVAFTGAIRDGAVSGMLTYSGSSRSRRIQPLPRPAPVQPL